MSESPTDHEQTTNTDDRGFWRWTAAVYDQMLAPLRGTVDRAAELAADEVAGADRLLEVGAGTGLMTEQLAPRVGELVAVDYAAPMVEACSERVAAANLTNVTCDQGDIYDLSYPDDRFDAVVAGNLLHLLPYLDGAFAEIRRVLRPGGDLVAPTFCHANTWVSSTLSRVLAAMGEPMHRRMTTESLRRTVADAGFTVRRTETVAGLIPIGYVAGRLVDGDEEVG